MDWVKSDLNLQDYSSGIRLRLEHPKVIFLATNKRTRGASLSNIFMVMVIDRSMYVMHKSTVMPSLNAMSKILQVKK